MPLPSAPVPPRRAARGPPGRCPAFVGGLYFTVIGIPAPVPPAPEIERSALIGWEAAGQLPGFDGHPTAVYGRSADDRVTAVRGLIAPTADPQSPGTVSVTDPSAALLAKAATEGAFSTLPLGPGAINLLGGGVGWRAP